MEMAAPEKKAKFERTQEILAKSGLLDITKRTALLIRNNQEVHQRLAKLREEVNSFVESVLANPENRERSLAVRADFAANPLNLEEPLVPRNSSKVSVIRAHHSGTTTNPHHSGTTTNPHHSGTTTNPQYGGQAANPQLSGPASTQYTGAVDTQYSGGSANPQYSGPANPPQYSGSVNTQYSGGQSNPRHVIHQSSSTQHSGVQYSNSPTLPTSSSSSSNSLGRTSHQPHQPHQPHQLQQHHQQHQNLQ